jgi:uncharacterized membrane protein
MSGSRVSAPLPPPMSRAERAAALDLTVARLLNIGTLFSVTLLAIGVVLMALAGRSPLDLHFPALNLGRLVSDIVALRPEGFLWLGLIAVILTPTTRVATSLVGFVQAGDRTMVLISALILGVIATSVVISAVVQ